MKPKISIIIPVYNVEGYLRKCLDSILAQTFCNFDVFIVDDGSTDRTGEICDEYKNKDERINVIHKENEGVSVARNTAIDIATGDYFLFFDGDDHVESECLAELYETAVSQNADSVLYGYYLEENGSVIETHPPRMEKAFYEGEEIITDLVPRFIGVSYHDIRDWIDGDKDALKKENTALWRSMVRGDLIRKNNIRFKPQLRVGEDTCFTTEYLSCAERCAVLHKCYYYLVVRETSTISVYEKNSIAVLNGKTDLLTARRELTERIKKRRDFDIEEYWYGTVIMSCIQLAVLLAKKNNNCSLSQRYKAYKSYLEQEETKRAIKNFIIKFKNLKSLPFLLLKGGHHFIIFLAAWLINLLPYKFKR